jgi:hypothetical protein
MLPWLLPRLAFADDVQRPIRPPRVAEPPRIDGRLDEPLWGDALVIDDFVQRQPREGEPASERAEVRIAHTPTDLGLRFAPGRSGVDERAADSLLHAPFPDRPGESEGPEPLPADHPLDRSQRLDCEELARNEGLAGPELFEGVRLAQHEPEQRQRLDARGLSAS